MSEARSGSPAGIPSRMPTSAGPCDSPAVRKRSTQHLSRISPSKGSRELEREIGSDGDYPRPLAALSTPVLDQEKPTEEAFPPLQPPNRAPAFADRVTVRRRSAARDPGGKARSPDDRGVPRSRARSRDALRPDSQPESEEKPSLDSDP